MRIFAIITFLFQAQAFASECFIETYDKILILSDGANNSKLIKRSDCDSSTLADFASFASKAQGRISQRFISKALPKVKLIPSEVTFLNITEQLNIRSILPRDGRVTKARKINGEGFIGLTKDQRFDIDCSSCPSIGEHTLKIVIKDTLGQVKETQWVKAAIGVPTRALVAKRSVTATLGAINASDFAVKTIISEQPQKLLPADFPLHFHKISRSLSGGELLTRANVSPLQLVRPGVPAQVTIKGSGITVSGSASPLTYGVWGEVIKLKNTNSQRVIMGKVVDHNKVVVKL